MPKSASRGRFAGVQQHVGRLDVAVHDARGRARAPARRRAARRVSRTSATGSGPSLDPLGQGRALDQVGDHERAPGLGAAVVQPDEAGVVELRQRGHLLALLAQVVQRGARAEQLDRHLAAAVQVATAPDHRRGSDADHRAELVAAARPGIRRRRGAAGRLRSHGQSFPPPAQTMRAAAGFALIRQRRSSARSDVLRRVRTRRSTSRASSAAGGGERPLGEHPGQVPAVLAGRGEVRRRVGALVGQRGGLLDGRAAGQRLLGRGAPAAGSRPC